MEKVKSELENVVKKLDQMSIRSELFLKEKMKQDIVKDLKVLFGDDIVSECWINVTCLWFSYIEKDKWITSNFFHCGFSIETWNLLLVS